MVPPLIWEMTTPVVGHGRLVRTIQQAFLDVIQDDFIVGRILQNGDRDAGTDLGEVGRHLHRLIFKICVYRRSSAVRLDNHPGSRGLLRLRRLVGRGGRRGHWRSRLGRGRGNRRRGCGDRLVPERRWQSS